MTPADGPPRVDVLGVGISCITVSEAVDVIADWIDSGRREYICVTGMHGVMESRRDPVLCDIHNRSGLTTPDGMPMVWAGRWAGASIERVYGPDLMHAVLSRAASDGWSSYFLGGTPGVTRALLKRLAVTHQGLLVAGTANPPFRPLTGDEDNAIVGAINAARPDIVWVGLGTPKQEHWMATHREKLDAPVLVGIGAALDLLSGTLRQAPRWMQRSGLEWAFRLTMEPRRLWRRYLVNIPKFLAAVLRHPPKLRD